MNTRSNSEERFNELVFENRNKDYGAYAIRSEYSDTVAKSLAITLTGVTIFVCLMVYLSHSNAVVKLVTDAYFPPEISVIVEVPHAEDPKPEVKPAATKDPLPPKVDNPNYKPSDDPLQKDLKPTDKLNLGAVPNDKGVDSSKAPEHIELPPVDPPVVKAPVVYADVMPKFKGDVYSFIGNHLKYPQMAVENSTQGTVYLSFIVEKNGSIGDISILGKKLGDGCTEEAIRVIKMMPDWEPGMNKGEPVRVIYNLPIRFRLK